MIDALVLTTYIAEALPLLLCLLLALRDRDPGHDAWWIAGALAVSFAMDSIALQIGHQGLNNHWLGYVGYPVQFGLLVGVCAIHRPWRVVLVSALLVVGLAGAIRGPLNQPEIMVRAAGGAWVSFLVWRSVPMRRWRLALWCYAGLTIPAVLLMGDPTDPRYLTAWTAYQSLRLMGLALMVWALVRKEVPRELRVVETREPEVGDQHWPRLSGAGWDGHRRHDLVAQKAER